LLIGVSFRLSVSLSGVILPADRHIHTLYVATWLAAEIEANQRGIRERVDRESQAVAIEANGTDHLLVGTQVGILVMLHPNVCFASGL
jgi:hypothetical protein